MFALGSLVYSTPDSTVYPPGRVVLHGVGNVAVQVQGGRDCGMPEAFLSNLRMNARP